MRKRNLVIAIVAGLGIVGAALAMVLTPPTPEAKAQTLIAASFDTITFVGVRLFPPLLTNPDNPVLSIQGSYAGEYQTIRLEFDAADDRHRWLVDKCYSQANKVMNEPGKFIHRITCRPAASIGPECDLIESVNCTIQPVQTVEPPGDSCEGSCGGQSPDGCWCDYQCAQFGDCCPDYATVCGP